MPHCAIEDSLLCPSSLLSLSVLCSLKTVTVFPHQSEFKKVEGIMILSSGAWRLADPGGWAPATLLTQDSTTYRFMILDCQARHHIKKAVTQTADYFTDKDCKHFLQASVDAGTFPTKHKLWLINSSDSGFCPSCPQELQHMVHWQCLCPHFHDSLQAAHNAIVQSFHFDLM